MRVDYQGLSKAQQLFVVMVHDRLRKEINDRVLTIECLLSDYERSFGIEFEVTRGGWKAYVTDDVKVDNQINYMLNRRL